MTVLIKNVLMLGLKRRDIYIEGNRIKKVGNVREKADFVIDGKDKAALPGLVNMHTHAAMTLFRGFADDMDFYEAWPKKVWPAEARLTGKDVYAGTKLACLEMIKTGTTCFNDMYFYPEYTARAVKEMGLRATVSEVYLDTKSLHVTPIEEKKTFRIIEKVKKAGGSRVIPALGPHAIYTVSKENLRRIKEYSDKKNLLMHFHLCETRKENEDCLKQHGKRPVEVLEEIGFLNSKLVAAHSVWLTKGEIGILAKHKVNVVHTPTSNMKLAVGGVMPYEEMRKAGVNVTLGTDGCASNNNLDMFESMKISALLQKHHLWNQTILPAREALETATTNAGKALKIDIGIIGEGMLADIILADLKTPALTPNHNLISNLVYSTNGSCVDTVICDGKILMQDRKIKGEEKILKEAEKTAEKVMAKTPSGGGH
ncbi:MAG: amidohydrolase [Candidatus Altiarchaeales archaeon]|nr:amidohydrolase [Candidatus Altiarchaeales archaeon]